jgi:hypothetical protein
VGAFFCFQRGLQTGNALPVIALMTSGTNVASILGGLLVFGDPLGHRPAMVALHAAAFAIVIGAAWLLAPAQAAVTTAGEAGGSDGEGSRVHEAVPETCDADPSAAA